MKFPTLSNSQKQGLTLLIAVIGLMLAMRKWYKITNMESAELNELPSSFDIVEEAPISGVPSTANFKASEFDCKDGTPVPSSLYGNLQALMNELQALRDYLGVPIMINSGYRTPSHNKKVGGVTSSQHLKAKAADIRVPGRTPKQVKTAIEHLIATGAMRNGGVGLYATFVHYDIGSVRRW